VNNQAQSAPAAADLSVWLPPEAFFVRRITLDPTMDAALQVELALEATAPFALEQLYYGYLSAPDGLTALVFATHRRIFPGEGWPEAAVVLPGFAALLGEPPSAARLRLWQTEGSLVAAAWDGNSPLPCIVLTQQAEPANEATARTTLLDELIRRLGGKKPELEEFGGSVDAGPTRKGPGLELRLNGRAAGRILVTVLDPAALETMDVRDKGALLTRRQDRRRNRLLWGALTAALAGLAVAAVLEGVLFAGGLTLKRWRDEQARVAVEVHKIETAQTLSTRIEEMTQRRLRPFEMLAVLNEDRPASIQFLRCVTSGLNTLEIEGQTGNAASVGDFETALRSLGVLASFEIRDVRLREGTTTFQLTAVFKPGALAEKENRS
jgi:hypothetical protein